MNERIERVKEEIENFLKNSVDHQNKHIDYILVDPDTNETYVLASDGYDEAIEFTPLSKNSDAISKVSEVTPSYLKPPVSVIIPVIKHVAIS